MKFVGLELVKCEKKDTQNAKIRKNTDDVFILEV
ncbi:Hypothetical protein HPV225_1558 [Helicobacter pylori v225d]|nr:Hypothetical protein HPV225_1558 [Helicobacter pylori v225d]